MLKIRNLRVLVEGKEVVRGVSLGVKSGEVHAVMGPNGSGKSSLAHALAGHPAYTIGVGNVKFQISNSKQTSNIKSQIQNSSVMMDGEDLLEMSPDERARAGLFLAFQYPVEVPGVRVVKFLKEARNVRFEDMPKKQFDSALKLRNYLEELGGELGVKKELLRRGLNEGFSGGEKKRLEILQMALIEPKYAVLDETDSGLDIDAVKAVAKGVRKIVKKHDTGVIVITHYQRILKYLKPDFVHVMVEGKIVESGGMEIVKKLEKRGYERLLEEL